MRTDESLQKCIVPSTFHDHLTSCGRNDAEHTLIQALSQDEVTELTRTKQELALKEQAKAFRTPRNSSCLLNAVHGSPIIRLTSYKTFLTRGLMLMARQRRRLRYNSTLHQLRRSFQQSTPVSGVQELKRLKQKVQDSGDQQRISTAAVTSAEARVASAQAERDNAKRSLAKLQEDLRKKTDEVAQLEKHGLCHLAGL